MGIKQTVLAGLAALNINAAPKAVDAAESASEAPSAPESIPADSPRAKLDEVTDRIAAKADRVGDAYETGETTYIAYNLRTDSEFSERYGEGQKTAELTAKYIEGIKETLQLVEASSNIQFIPASQEATLDKLADYEEVDITISGKTPTKDDDTAIVGTMQRGIFSNDEIALYVPTIEAQPDPQHNLVQSTMMHETMHYLGVNDHAEEMDLGKLNHPKYTSMQAEDNGRPNYDGIPEVDLMAISKMYGLPETPEVTPEKLPDNVKLDSSGNHFTLEGNQVKVAEDGAFIDVQDTANIRVNGEISRVSGADIAELNVSADNATVTATSPRTIALEDANHTTVYLSAEHMPVSVKDSEGVTISTSLKDTSELDINLQNSSVDLQQAKTENTTIHLPGDALILKDGADYTIMHKNGEVSTMQATGGSQETLTFIDSSHPEQKALPVYDTAELGIGREVMSAGEAESIQQQVVQAVQPEAAAGRGR